MGWTWSPFFLFSLLSCRWLRDIYVFKCSSFSTAQWGAVQPEFKACEISQIILEFASQLAVICWHTTSSEICPPTRDISQQPQTRTHSYHTHIHTHSTIGHVIMSITSCLSGTICPLIKPHTMWITVQSPCLARLHRISLGVKTPWLKLHWFLFIHLSLFQFFFLFPI